MDVQKNLENYHVLFAPSGPIDSCDTHRLLVVLKYHFVALQLLHSVACTYIVVMKVLEFLVVTLALQLHHSVACTYTVVMKVLKFWWLR